MKKTIEFGDSDRIPIRITNFLLYSITLSVAFIFIFNGNLLVKSYFGTFEEVIFASVSFIPVITSLYIAKLYKKPLPVGLFAGFAGVGIILSYLSSLEMRELFSRLYGIYLVQVGLADWLFIPNFVGCQDPSGCDPLGRVPGYGLTWKVLLFLSNETFSVFVLAVAALYVIIEVGRFSNILGFPFLQLTILVSPSFLFAIERGNSDILLFALIILGTRLSGKYRGLDLSMAFILTTLKPFFFGYIFKQMPSKRILMMSIPIFFTCYFWSMNSSLQLIKSVRVSTLYPPFNQIGAEQLPSFLIQFLLTGMKKQNLPWDSGIEIFYVSLIAGLFLTILIGLITLRYFDVNDLLFEISKLPSRYSRLTWVSMGVYLLVFLSGSQVSYKSWMVFPLMFISLKSAIKNGKSYGKMNLIFVSLLIFGCLGINFWLLRTMGTLFLAGLCLALFSCHYFPTLKTKAIFQRSSFDN